MGRETFRIRARRGEVHVRLSRRIYCDVSLSAVAAYSRIYICASSSLAAIDKINFEGPTALVDVGPENVTNYQD